MSKGSERVIKWRKRTKQKMIESMGGCCKLCGYDRCQEAMDFHHIDPNEKEFSFSSVRASPKSLSSLINELKKCVLLCSRCHREVHAGMVKVEIPSILDESKLISEVELKRKLKQQSTVVTQKKNKRKIFVSDEQLLELLEVYDGNKSALARYLNVSETAIRKKLSQNSTKEL